MASNICCVVGCPNRKGGKVSLFRVHTREESDASFIDILQPFLKEGLKGCENLKICEVHFEEQYIVPKYKTENKKGKTILPNAIPIFWPCPQSRPDPSTLGCSSGSSVSKPAVQPLEVQTSPSPSTSTEIVLDTISRATLRNGWSILNRKDDLYMIYVTSICDGPIRIIRVTENLKIETRVNGNLIFLTEIPETCRTLNDIFTTMTAMESLKKCSGPNVDQQCSIGLFQGKTGHIQKSCNSCESKKKKLLLEQLKEKRKSNLFRRNKEKIKEQNRKLREMRIENDNLKIEIDKMRKKNCAELNEHHLDEDLNNFSQNQKESQNIK